MKSDFKRAFDHWLYNSGALRKALDFSNLSEAQKEKIVSLTEYYYIQAMIHGFKHGREDERIKISREVAKTIEQETGVTTHEH